MRGVQVLAVAAAAALLAGCAARPERVAGAPAPVTPVATAGSASARTPAASPPPATPSGTARPPTPTPSAPAKPTPALPARYEPLQLTGSGVTVELPVPAGWTRTRTVGGWDLDDPSGQLLLRVEVRARSGETVQAIWQENEDGVRARLAGYRLLGTEPVTGVGEDALDWTFTFERDGVRRQVVDRLIVLGEAGIAVYFSAPERHYSATVPVWERAVAGLRLT